MSFSKIHQQQIDARKRMRQHLMELPKENVLLAYRAFFEPNRDADWNEKAMVLANELALIMFPTPAPQSGIIDTATAGIKTKG